MTFASRSMLTRGWIARCYTATSWATWCATCWVLCCLPQAATAATPPAVDAFLQKYCVECHAGTDAEAMFDVEQLVFPGQVAPEEIAGDEQDEASRDARSRQMEGEQFERWELVLRRVRDREMPPREATVPSVEESQQFATLLEQSLRAAACGDGISPGPPVIRRLNRSEYANTIRDLLQIPVDVSQVLPADGAGGEGFDNAGETLFLSPLHAEKYVEAARTATTYALREPNARRRLLKAEPGEEPDASVTPEGAAEIVLDEFLPRAFRRPLEPGELEEYLELFKAAYAEESAYEPALQLALEAALVSPHFLFRIEQPNFGPEQQVVGDYEMASRLSYFLWNTMPDDQLMRAAREGELRDEQGLREQVARMLGSGDSQEDRRGRRGRRPRREAERVRDFAESFVEQWLGTRALGREFKPDPSVARRYDSELEGGMKYEPVLFFQELLTSNLSLLNLIDSDFTFANRALARHYRIRGEFREQPRQTELPEDSPRGGVLGMSAVLAVSSYPHRTSPVLRGKWIMESLLGSPPAPPPPDVPALEENHEGAPPRTVRERLEQHRLNPACASCHDRMDPLGFSLENFDVLGRWRDEEGGQPIDARGQLPDGTTFEGPDGLKQVLLDRKDEIMRNLTAKMLGYALGRGLTQEDYCTVDEIVEKLKQNDYAAQTLVTEIVLSVPFRYKAGTAPEQQHDGN